jgi:hypothetical protein
MLKKNISNVTLYMFIFQIINDEPEIPRVVYVSRERRPSLPHKFKGGALNTLVCTF